MLKIVYKLFKMMYNISVNKISEGNNMKENRQKLINYIIEMYEDRKLSESEKNY